MSGQRRADGSWNRVAGDNSALHYFTDTTRPQWWREAVCGVGPAVGKSDGDSRLESCATCLRLDPRTEHGV
jgi:hypothetical protein